MKDDPHEPHIKQKSGCTKASKCPRYGKVLRRYQLIEPLPRLPLKYVSVREGSNVKAGKGRGPEQLFG